MSTKNDGGRAFPVPFHYNMSDKGMSRLDYFAAHAPAVPDWFKFDANEKPPGPRLSELTVEQVAEYRMYKDGKITSVSAEVLDYLRRCHETADEREAWRNEQRERKFFAWRWHYARTMLAGSDE